jgi:hypothetical protein
LTLTEEDTMKTARVVLPVMLLITRRGKVSNLSLAALIWLALVMLNPAGVQAQSVLSDDADISLANRNANHGANPNLNVSSSERVYLKFKLSTLPADTPGSEVEKATLKVYLGKVKEAGKLELFAVAGNWDETGITANNAPPLGSLVATTEEIGLGQEGKFVAIDITSLVQQWLGDDGQGANGLPNYGIAILAQPTATPRVAELSLDSKENAETSHEAQLTIQLRRASGLQRVSTDPTLKGDGTSGLPLGVAPGAINTVHLADNAVTGGKIADGAVASSELANAAVTGDKIADGAVTSAKVTSPLLLTSVDPTFTLSVVNTGGGAAVKASGPIDTTTHYNIGGQRVLSVAGTTNLFAGIGAGGVNTTGQGNSFFGPFAGVSNTQGSNNSFFGKFAGFNNTSGQGNSYFGHDAGFSNMTGFANSFFGRSAGGLGSAGSLNSFFGSQAGEHNEGNNNSFFGAQTGQNNSTGGSNAFFGVQAGQNNSTGGSNAFFGLSAGLSNVTGSNNSFFGRSAGQYTQGNNNSFFGSAAGLGNSLQSNTGSNNSFFGASAGIPNTTGESNAFFGHGAGSANTTGSFNTFFGSLTGVTNTTESFNTYVGYEARGEAGITNATAIGANALVTQSNSLVLGNFNPNTGQTDTNVGIGTTAPKTRLHVVGNVYVAGGGLILKSPSGACFELTVTNAGVLTATAIECP